MKSIDITEKLNFDEKPTIRIKDTVLIVNNDAASILKILPKIDEKEISMQSVADIVDIMFAPEEKAKLDALGLNLKDYMTVIFTAVQLVAGDGEGEAQTRTTT